MKKKIITSLAILFTILFAVSSCKKDAMAEEVDLAESVQGTYEVYYIMTQGQPYNLPQDSLSATIFVNRTDKNVVTISSRTIVAGVSDDDELGSVQLKKESSTTVMYSGSDKLGTISNNELEISGKDNQGHDLIIKARK